jgi:hypothetical protein
MATGAVSTVTMSALDLGKIRIASFSAAGRCVVTGDVANVSTNYVSGSGTMLDPYVTTQTAFRMPRGTRMMYYPKAGNNAYLQAVSYRVADLSGAAGQGGILTPFRPAGTVIVIK